MYEEFDTALWLSNAGMSHKVGLNLHEVLRLHDELRGTRLTLLEGIARMGYSISQFAEQARVRNLRGVLASHLKLYHCEDCHYWYDDLIAHDCSFAKQREHPGLRPPDYVVAHILKAHQERYLACEALKQSSTLESVRLETQRIREAEVRLEVLYDMIGRDYRPRPIKLEEWPDKWPIEEVEG